MRSRSQPRRRPPAISRQRSWKAAALRCLVALGFVGAFVAMATVAASTWSSSMASLLVIEACCLLRRRFAIASTTWNCSSHRWCRPRAGAGGVQPVVRQEAREALAAREWAGNVRELFNALDAAALRAGSVIGVDALGLPPASTRAAPGSAAGSLQDVEREAIVQALARTGNNVTKAAKELGIARATLHRRLRTYRLRGYAPPS